MLRKLLPALCVAAAMLRGAPAFAQADGGPDPSTVRVRIGPLMMNPTISISNVGIDHNVFNDPPDKAPKQDFTFTVVPLSDFWLRAGNTWITASLNESINWYQKYASERTANNSYKVGWFYNGSRMTFKTDGTYTTARERPGFEIDTRAAHKDLAFNGAIDFNMFAQTFIGVTASRAQTRFASDAEFNGTNLQTSLNRVTSTYGLTARHNLTPLTTLSFSATRAVDRFEFSPDRDTTTTTAQGTIALAPAALVRGSVSFGYTDFKPADPTLPGYQGTVANADVTYVFLGSTRFALTGGRNVQYSYDILQPYYIQSRIGGSIAQQLFGPFDVQVRGDVAFLDYRNRAGAKVEVADRQDRVTTVGVGLGFHMGRDLRLSFNVDQNNRDTKVLEHAYEKFLIGTALTYGIK